MLWPRKRPRSRSASRVEAHQRMARLLAEHAGQLGGLERAQLLVRPRPVGAKPVGERPGDREVARAARPLAQRREPARAEVDRVEREQVGGHARRASPRGSARSGSSAGASGPAGGRAASRSIDTKRAVSAISRRRSAPRRADPCPPSYTAPRARRVRLPASSASATARRSRLAGVDLERPAGRAVRAAGPQRRRQVDAREDRLRPGAPIGRRGPGDWRARRVGRGAGQRSATSPSCSASRAGCAPTSCSSSTSGWPARAAGRPSAASCSSWWAWRRPAGRRSRRCRRACSSGSASRRRWWARRGC